jgi:hypothetical protein
MSEVVA